MAESAGGNILKNIPDGFYTTNQAAELVGCNPYTLRRWLKNKVYIPKQPSLQAGKLSIPIYGQEDIEAMKNLYSRRRDHVHSFPIGP
jgi:hypothetical protein